MGKLMIHPDGRCLEAGLRTGEMIGLTWGAIAFEKRALTVTRALQFRHGEKDWRAGSLNAAEAFARGMQPKVLQKLPGHADSKNGAVW